MPLRCAYVKCPSDSTTLHKRNAPVRLHLVPDEERQYVMEMFGINKAETQKIKLCSLHFREEAFAKEGLRHFMRRDIVFRDFLIPPGEGSEKKPAVDENGKFQMILIK